MWQCAAQQSICVAVRGTAFRLCGTASGLGTLQHTRILVISRRYPRSHLLCHRTYHRAVWRHVGNPLTLPVVSRMGWASADKGSEGLGFCGAFLSYAGLEPYVPPAPPLFPKLPHDLFYPFHLGDGAT